MAPARRVENPGRIAGIEPRNQPPGTTPLDQRVDGAYPSIVDDEIRARPATDQDTLARRDHERGAAAALEHDHLPGRGMQGREIGPGGRRRVGSRLLRGLVSRLVRAAHAVPIPPQVVDLWPQPLYSHGPIAASQPALHWTRRVQRVQRPDSTLGTPLNPGN